MPYQPACLVEGAARSVSLGTLRVEALEGPRSSHSLVVCISPSTISKRRKAPVLILPRDSLSTKLSMRQALPPAGLRPLAPFVASPSRSLLYQPPALPAVETSRLLYCRCQLWRPPASCRAAASCRDHQPAVELPTAVEPGGVRVVLAPADASQRELRVICRGSAAHSASSQPQGLEPSPEQAPLESPP
jgi:hypothetical protein